MFTVLYAVPAYLVGTFTLSAMMVRLVPKAHSSRQIRKHLLLFTALPLLLVTDMLSFIDMLRRIGSQRVRQAFETLSGRYLHSSDENAYAYFGYPRRRQDRRRSNRPSRSLNTNATVASFEGRARSAVNDCLP